VNSVVRVLARYYKNQGTAWVAGLDPPVSEFPGTDARIVFNVRMGRPGYVTLYNALGFKGGDTLAEKAQILLRQAVAAVLNESRFGSSFGDFTMAELIAEWCRAREQDRSSGRPRQSGPVEQRLVVAP
jgi:hypothetical protein